MFDSIHKLMYSRPACSFYFFFFFKNNTILKVHSAATPTRRGSVSLTEAVTGWCCPPFHRVLLGGRAGNSRDLDLKLWIWERRDAGWACGVGISYDHSYDHLGCPSWALQFHRSHLFLLMCWKARGCGGSWLGEWLHKHFLNF